MGRKADPLRGVEVQEVRVPDGFQNKLRLAEEAVERAISLEAQHTRGTGGHRHSGPHPLLQLPLPSGWRKHDQQT